NALNILKLGARQRDVLPDRSWLPNDDQRFHALMPVCPKAEQVRAGRQTGSIEDTHKRTRLLKAVMKNGYAAPQHVKNLQQQMALNGQRVAEHGRAGERVRVIRVERKRTRDLKLRVLRRV